MADTPQADGLTFRQGDLLDPASWAAVANLLSDIFGIDVTPLDRMGGPDPSSMAFSWFAPNGLLAANLSAFALPILIDGRPVNAAGLQSGAVRPEFRGRGLFRDVTEKALDWCDMQRFEAVLLYTEKPTLYEKYGFVALPQSRFVAEAPPADGTPSPVRRLDFGRPDDLALIRKTLETRRPVSNRFAVSRQSEMFLLNAWLSDDVRLDYLKTLDAIIAWRLGEDDAFELLDIVATAIPALDDILASLSVKPRRASIDFVPDRLACHFTSAADDDPLFLMMRSTGAHRPDGPIRLPELANF